MGGGAISRTLNAKMKSVEPICFGTSVSEHGGSGDHALSKVYEQSPGLTDKPWGRLPISVGDFPGCCRQVEVNMRV